MMEGKDDKNTSIYPPLEIFKDMFGDKDLLENVTEDVQNILRAKAAQLKEVSPACNCADLGLKGKLCEVFMQKIIKYFIFSGRQRAILHTVGICSNSCRSETSLC